MRPEEGPFIRPLLEVSRRQILAYLESHRLSWLQDPSNSDPAFTRNRLRHDLLPRLQAFNPRIEEHLARLGRRLALEEDFWQVETEKAFAPLARFDGEGLYLDRPLLLDLHPAMRARVLRRALRQVRGDLRSLAAVHLESLEALLQGERPQADCHLPGAWVGRRYDRLWVRPAPPSEPADSLLSVAGPGIFPLPGGELRVTVEPAALGEGPLAVEFDFAGITFPLIVRRPRPGDRFRPAGLGGRKKLKDFFIDAKLDRESRRQVLVVEGEEILWLIGIRRCDKWRPPLGGTVLRLDFHLPEA